MSTVLNLSDVEVSAPATASRPALTAVKAVRIAEAVALGILFGITLEGASRVEDWVEFRTSILARERSQEDLLVRDVAGMHGRPGGHFQKWSLNALGMRGPAVPRDKPPRTIRVITAGASETFGLYESPGHEYPRQLEARLKVLFAESRECKGISAEVLNAAMPGMSLPTIEQDIRLRVSQLRPDFVLLYATPAAYLDNTAPVAARPDTTVLQAPPLPARNALFPRVADRIRTQIKTLLPTPIQDRLRRQQIAATLAEHPAGWRFTTVPSERLEQFDSDLRRSVGSIRATGAVPVLMTHANRFIGTANPDRAALRAWEKFYPRASGQTIVAIDSLARLRTIAIARDSQAVVVDLPPHLSGLREKAFADYSHFTDAGAAVTATAIATPLVAAANANGTCETRRRSR